MVDLVYLFKDNFPLVVVLENFDRHTVDLAIFEMYVLVSFKGFLEISLSRGCWSTETWKSKTALLCSHIHV